MGWKCDYMRLMGQLRRGREKVGLSQTEVAARLGISLRMFQRYEGSEESASGDDIYQPKAMVLFEWAAVVGVRITSDMTYQEKEAGHGSAR